VPGVAHGEVGHALAARGVADERRVLRPIARIQQARASDSPDTPRTRGGFSPSPCTKTTAGLPAGNSALSDAGVHPRPVHARPGRLRFPCLSARPRCRRSGVWIAETRLAPSSGNQSPWTSTFGEGALGSAESLPLLYEALTDEHGQVAGYKLILTTLGTEWGRKPERDLAVETTG
jgi:hypothetical protein